MSPISHWFMQAYHIDTHGYSFCQTFIVFSEDFLWDCCTDYWSEKLYQSLSCMKLLRGVMLDRYEVGALDILATDRQGLTPHPTPPHPTPPHPTEEPWTVFWGRIKVGISSVRRIVVYFRVPLSREPLNNPAQEIVLLSSNNEHCPDHREYISNFPILCSES